MRYVNKIAVVLLACMFLFSSSLVPHPSSLVYAAVPHLINYQGKLTDKTGKPVSDTAQSITFRIYDAESGGNLLWQETQSVTTQKGIFNVLLGSVTNLDIAFDKPYWLEIKVAEEIMSPRQRMTSAAYAMRAEHGVPRGVIVMWSGRISDIPPGWTLCNGTNGAPDLRDKFIVGARQDDNGIAKTNISNSLTQIGGETVHVLTIDEIPAHTHTLPWVTGGGTGSDHPNFARSSTTESGSVGGGKGHNNLPPYYALAYIMKL